MDRQERRFGKAIMGFVRGTHFRPSGRANYLHILSWLKDARSWAISLSEELAHHPNEKASVRFSQRLLCDHLVLELDEDESGLGDVVDLAGAEHDALEGAPGLGDQGKARSPGWPARSRSRAL